MIFCKITNNTGSGITLNWVRGGISIPKNASAILDYDPFSLMDRNGSVYKNALDLVDAKLISIGYCAKHPAVMLDSIQAPVVAPDAPVKEHKEPKNRLFDESDPYHKNDFVDSVQTPKAAEAPKAEPEPVTMEVTVPADAPKDEAKPKAPSKKSSGKKTKEI